MIRKASSKFDADMLLTNLEPWHSRDPGERDPQCSSAFLRPSRGGEDEILHWKLTGYYI